MKKVQIPKKWQIVSKKGDIFVHNTKQIDGQMIIALDILCKYKTRIAKYYKGY